MGSAQTRHSKVRSAAGFHEPSPSRLRCAAGFLEPSHRPVRCAAGYHEPHFTFAWHGWRSSEAKPGAQRRRLPRALPVQAASRRRLPLTLSPPGALRRRLPRAVLPLGCWLCVHAASRLGRARWHRTDARCSAPRARSLCPQHGLTLSRPDALAACWVLHTRTGSSSRVPRQVARQCVLRRAARRHARVGSVLGPYADGLDTRRANALGSAWLVARARARIGTHFTRTA